MAVNLSKLHVDIYLTAERVHVPPYGHHCPSKCQCILGLPGNLSKQRPHQACVYFWPHYVTFFISFCQSAVFPGFCIEIDLKLWLILTLQYWTWPQNFHLFADFCKCLKLFESSAACTVCYNICCLLNFVQYFAKMQTTLQIPLVCEFSWLCVKSSCQGSLGYYGIFYNF